MEYEVPLTTLDDQVTRTICAENCQAKCCDFALNDFSVTVLRSDFNRLRSAGLTEMVTFAGDDHPQLLNKVNGSCVFLDEDSHTCGIHEIRPVACRAYPFKKRDRKAIPEWCELYYQASSELQKKLQNQPWEELVDLQVEDTDDYYDQLLQVGDLYLQDHITDRITLDGGRSYWSVFMANGVNRKEVIKLIRQLTKDYTDLDWYAFSLRYYTDQLEFQFQINGLTRSNFNVLPPHITQFPPQADNLKQLLHDISTSTKYKEHFIAGVNFQSSVDFSNFF